MSSTNFHTSALLAPNTGGPSHREIREIPPLSSLVGRSYPTHEINRSQVRYQEREERLPVSRSEGRRQLEEEHQEPIVGKQRENDCEKDTNNSSSNQQQSGSLPSYTAMIAQAVLSKEGHKSTLSEIYEYMEKTFPALGRRGTGWRNCVRHTLSLNDCFVKLHRPENGRSCNWAVHPTYFESFSRGDYRKRRTIRKRARSLPWMDPSFQYPMQYFREQDYMQYQSNPWPYVPTTNGSSNAWNAQPTYHNTYGGYSQSQIHSTGHTQEMPRTLHHNNHASCHYMDPNCYCLHGQKTATNMDFYLRPR